MMKTLPLRRGISGTIITQCTPPPFRNIIFATTSSYNHCQSTKMTTIPFHTRHQQQQRRRQKITVSSHHHHFHQQLQRHKKTPSSLSFSSSTTTTTTTTKNSNNNKTNKRHQRRSFIPRKAPVSLTPQSRQFFKSILEATIKKQQQQQQEDFSSSTNNNKKDDDIVGIMLGFQQSHTGQPRMVFTFNLVTRGDIHKDDESVSLDVASTDGNDDDDGDDDERPKLYVHRHAFMKVLGATIDMEEDGITPVLYDREGNVMDPTVV